jgi:hypothetical protein
MKGRLNESEMYNMVAKMLVQSSLVLYQDMNLIWGKGSYIEFCSGKETNRIAWLLIGGRNWEESEEKQIREVAHFI